MGNGKLGQWVAVDATEMPMLGMLSATDHFIVGVVWDGVVKSDPVVIGICRVCKASVALSVLDIPVIQENPSIIPLCDVCFDKMRT